MLKGSYSVFYPEKFYHNYSMVVIMCSFLNHFLKHLYDENELTIYLT